jgi:Flp pilus assembly protein TadB
VSGPALAALPVYAAGLGVGLGLTGLGVALVERRRDARRLTTGPAEPSPAPRRHGEVVRTVDAPLLVVAVLVGMLCIVVTGWPVAGPIGGLAAYGLPRLLRRTSTAASIATLEAIATWTEMLQGTLAASAGLGQAIITTADLSPAPIRGATEQLAAQMRAGVEPREALLRFAEDVGDPSADRVVCSLLLAMSARAQRLGDLLGALAESTREEVALRLRVETSRASIRSGVRTVIVFSVAFAALLAVLAHAYLAPFSSPEGQVVLAVVGGLYPAGLTLMVTLARPPKAIRLLGSTVERQ